MARRNKSNGDLECWKHDCCTCQLCECGYCGFNQRRNIVCKCADEYAERRNAKYYCSNRCNHYGTIKEIAPRPHNSGHHTIDACDCNQFEQQLRAVAGLEIGSTRQHTPAVMVNLLGEVWPGEMTPPDWSPVLNHPRAKLHLYGKRRALPKRKMGHFTILADTVEQAFQEAQAIKTALMLDVAPR